MAVVWLEARAHAGQVHEPVDRAQEMVHRHVPVQVKTVEQGLLQYRLLALIARSSAPTANRSGATEPLQPRFSTPSVWIADGPPWVADGAEIANPTAEAGNGRLPIEPASLVRHGSGRGICANRRSDRQTWSGRSCAYLIMRASRLKNGGSASGHACVRRP
jgi:hypothetical protein